MQYFRNGSTGLVGQCCDWWRKLHETRCGTLTIFGRNGKGLYCCAVMRLVECHVRETVM